MSMSEDNVNETPTSKRLKNCQTLSTGKIFRDKAAQHFPQQASAWQPKGRIDLWEKKKKLKPKNWEDSV